MVCVTDVWKSKKDFIYKGGFEKHQHNIINNNSNNSIDIMTRNNIDMSVPTERNASIKMTEKLSVIEIHGMDTKTTTLLVLTGVLGVVKKEMKN